MRAAIRELKMVVHTFTPEHDAVEPVVILEAAENPKAEPVAIHRAAALQIADRSSNTEMRFHDDPL
jgi:hypothetical protein